MLVIPTNQSRTLEGVMGKRCGWDPSCSSYQQPVSETWTEGPLKRMEKAPLRDMAYKTRNGNKSISTWEFNSSVLIQTALRRFHRERAESHAYSQTVNLSAIQTTR